MNNASLILDKIAANIIRNTKAIDIYHELREYDVEVDVYDPCLPTVAFAKEGLSR